MEYRIEQEKLYPAVWYVYKGDVKMFLGNKDAADEFMQMQARIDELEAYVKAAYEWFGNFCVHAPIQFGGEVEMGERAEQLINKQTA